MWIFFPTLIWIILCCIIDSILTITLINYIKRFFIDIKDKRNISSTSFNIWVIVLFFIIVISLWIYFTIKQLFLVFEILKVM